MWKPGSMGHAHGWHYGQAHDMMHEMRDYHQRWYGGADGVDISSPITSFIEGFAEHMGEKAADAVTGTKPE